MIFSYFSHLARHPRRLDSASRQRGTRGVGVANASATPVRLSGVLQGGACMVTCPKCSGCLVPAPAPLHLLSDYFIDTYDLQDPQGAAVKCLICGWYADSITIRNKAKQADAQRLVAQAEGWAMTHSVNTKGGLTHASTEKLAVCGRQDA